MVGGKVNFNQTIALNLNMYFDQSKELFQDKKVLDAFIIDFVFVYNGDGEGRETGWSGLC